MLFLRQAFCDETDCQDRSDVYDSIAQDDACKMRPWVGDQSRLGFFIDQRYQEKAKSHIVEYIRNQRMDRDRKEQEDRDGDDRCQQRGCPHTGKPDVQVDKAHGTDQTKDGSAGVFKKPFHVLWIALDKKQDIGQEDRPSRDTDAA